MRVDDSGRIILLPYGVMEVEGGVVVTQIDPTRTMQGADGIDLHTLAVDSEGRLIMLPYGWDGAAYRRMKVDDEGRMIGVMKGQADVKWGLRGWWKFVASEGTTIKDYSGYGNDGYGLSAAVAQANYEDGVIGQGILLDGVNDHVDCGADTSLDLTTALTLEAWIYPTNVTGYHVIISKWDSGWATTPYILLLYGTQVWFTVGDGVDPYYLKAGTIPIDEWTHILVTYGESDLKLYINGVYIDHLAAPATIITTVNQLYLGARAIGGTGWPFEGLIDEARIYGRCLSAVEVAWRYENTNPGTGKPTRMIAVDSEGRMRVNIEDMPYKEQLLVNEFIKSTAAASTIQVESDPVPEGKLWVIGSCMLSHDTNAVTTLKIGIKRGAAVYPFNEKMGAGTNDNLTIHAPLYLKAGDKLWSYCHPVGNNIYCWLRGNGYELDAG